MSSIIRIVFQKYNRDTHQWGGDQEGDYERSSQTHVRIIGKLLNLNTVDRPIGLPAKNGEDYFR